VCVYVRVCVCERERVPPPAQEVGPHVAIAACNHSSRGISTMADFLLVNLLNLPSVPRHARLLHRSTPSFYHYAEIPAVFLVGNPT